MKTIKSIALSFALIVFVSNSCVFAAVETKNAPQVMGVGNESKGAPMVSNAVAIKNDAEKFVKETKPVVIAVDPVPYYSNLQFVIYKDKVNLVDKTSNTVLETYLTKDAAAGRILFLDFNLGRDDHGMQIKGSYLIDLKQPDKLISTFGTHDKLIVGPGHENVIYEGTDSRGNYYIGIYDLKTKTNTNKQLPPFGFTGFLKFSEDGKYLLASSSTNAVYAIPLKTSAPVMYLNIPIPDGGHPTDYLTTKATFIGKDKARLTLTNGMTCIIKIADTGITLVQGPTAKHK